MAWINTPESTTVTRFDYQTDRRILLVEFKDGGRYQYYDVPGHVFEQMKAAASKGQFLAQKIKGAYRYARG
jgi:hypothetical protein